MAIKINTLFKSSKGLTDIVSSTVGTTKKIRGYLASDIKQKKQLYSNIKSFKKKRADREKLKVFKTRLMAPALVNYLHGPKYLTLDTQQGLSIGDRLMLFLKYVTAGWLLRNLPTWIAAGKEFVIRINRVGNIMKQYGNVTQSIFTDIYDLFKAGLDDISNFDFLDSSSKVKNAFSTLSKDIKLLGEGITKSFNTLIKPFQDIPPIGSDIDEWNKKRQEDQGTGQGGTGQGGGGQYPTKNPDFWTLVAISALEDSDPQGRADVAQSIYNRVASGRFPGGKNMKNVIIAEGGNQYSPVRGAVREFNQIQDRESAITAVMASGRYSRATAEKMVDATISAITNPALQRESARYIENRTDFLGKGLSPNQSDSTTELRRRNSDDNIFGNFVGSGSRQYGRDSRGASPVPPFVSGTSPSPTPSTVPLSSFAPISGTTGSSMGSIPISAAYGPFSPRSGATFTSSLGERWGRRHGGYDVGANPGTPLHAYFSGRVIMVGVDGTTTSHGYGNWIIWKDDVYGAYHFFGHMQKRVTLRVGQQFNQGDVLGYVGSTGSSTGPHLHWEISTSPPDSIGNLVCVNIPQWLNSHPIKKTPVQISSASSLSLPLLNPAVFNSDDNQQQVSMSRIGNSPNLTQERTGKTVVVIQDPGSSSKQQIISQSNSGMNLGLGLINEDAIINRKRKEELLTILG